MPINPDKILEYTGIKAETDEEFIAQFPGRFIPADQKNWDEETKNKTFGRTLGAVTIGIKQHFDEYGISLTGDDLKNTPEAVNKLGLQRLAEKVAAEKAELEKTAGLTADEKIKEAQETIGKLSKKNKDFEDLLKTKVSEFELLNQDKAAELKAFKLKSTIKDVHGAIQWNPDKDEYSRKGFLSSMDEKYGIELDENDQDYPFDRATGGRIKAEGSHSTWMGSKDLWTQEAIKAGMAAVNKKAGTPPVVKKVDQQNQLPKPGLPVAGRKVMANTSFVKE